MSSRDRQMQNSCWLEEDLLSEHDLFGKPPDIFPGHALLRTQYTAMVRQITLHFPHDTSQRNAALRRKVPITTTRSRNTQTAYPNTKTARQCLAVASVPKSMPDCRNVIS